MDRITALEERILDLEYRLRTLEKLLDLATTLYHKDDESTVNAIRIEVIQGMKKEGLNTKSFESTWGTKLYRKT